jgi:hypothetical protein
MIDPNSILDWSCLGSMNPLVSGEAQNTSPPLRLRPSRIVREPLPNSETHLSRVPSLVWNARDRSDDLPCRDGRRLRGERVQPGRAFRRLSDVNSEA